MRHWYDVLLVALPMLRPLRLLRFIALFRLLHRTAVTTMGRLIAAALMVVGITLVGAVTASLAAWSVDSATADREEADEQTEGQAV